MISVDAVTTVGMLYITMCSIYVYYVYINVKYVYGKLLTNNINALSLKGLLIYINYIQ